MSEHSVHTGEWEGFEQFHDISEANHSQLPEIKKNKANPKKEENPNNISHRKTIKRQPKQARKQVDIRTGIAHNHPPSLEKIEKQTQTIALPIEQKSTSKGETKRYERIPLIRFEEDCRYGGRIIYKSFVPKTSDKYLRTLKDIDWDLPKEKKREVRNLHGIEFNSQFQSGNLNLAIELEYDLYMRVDSNTNGHRQWFYFSMRNEKKCRVKLHIYRFKKVYSLFQRGMKPYVKSRKAGKDWMPGGDHVIYHYERHRNQYGVNKEAKTFVLTFSYTFEHENDEVFIAAGIPYTYTFLKKQLSFYKEKVDKRQSLSFEVTTLCKSMCGLELPIIAIEHKMSKLVNGNEKKIIIINARTHSGQSSSSWVLDGILFELAQSSIMDEWLLANNVVLKIVPMLNPDGVFIGNYRTGIIGDDFNRKFLSGRKQFYPEIHALKKLINHSKRQGTVELFLDLHGHSILKNSFIYGPSQADISKFPLKTLPYYLMHNSKYFRFSSCKFKTDKDNVETARVYFQLKEEILSFTCENSLGLYQDHSKTFQMLSADWQSFGQAILNSIISSYTDDSKIFSQPPTFKDPKYQSQAPSTLSNFLNQPERKFSSHVRITIQTSKHKKFEKTNIRFPSTNKNLTSEKKQKSLSTNQINREDEILQPTAFSNPDKTEDKVEKQGKRTPVSRLIQNIINRKRVQELQRNNSNEEKIMLERYITSEHSQILQRRTAGEEKNEQTEQQYEMEIINQNFSDEYISINDSDSEGDNLPEQEKNYLLECIKASHKTQGNEQDEVPSSPQKNIKGKVNRQPKISGFRQIRFRSIEEMQSKQINSTEPLHSNIKKAKLQTQKFKETTSNTFIFKGRTSQYQIDDPNIVTFSHQKKLNERSNHRRTYKDPFVLLQRKEKGGQKAQKHV